MQNIYLSFNFYIAKIIPNVMLTGNPGGTVIVTKSKNFTIISVTSTIACIFIIKIA